MGISDSNYVSNYSSWICPLPCCCSVTKWCPTLCDSMNCSLPGSSLHGISQARILESESEVAQSCPTLCDPMDCSLPGSSVHGIFPGKSTGVGLPFPSPGDLPNPGIEPKDPARDFHFLLQGIFPNQVLNLCLLLVRWIHYPRTTREAHSLLQYWLNSEALWGRSDCQQHHSLCSSSKGKYVSPVAPTLGCLSIALIYVDP